MDHCIVYLSSSKGLLSDEALTNILYHSQKNNRALDITGILLYFNGCIIQVLEGPEERVKALYEVIRRDFQHTQVIKLYDDSIEHRSFSDWSMGYKTLSARELDHLKHELLFIDEPFLPLSKEEERNPILSLVEVFYKNNYRN
ncbi:BLUF domain-containing protein [Spirosoma linguale]|uniref:BLUF domain protein n=1 Tax=Spirosoma linguale (strain ATCC 33905 / DSM 74 / LMG 10896 / Claus 1) TaxID=504472 RepID=D2QRB5_SPILD|nr:BLUF domain protein [Spirosoma linguale DSM 74]